MFRRNERPSIWHRRVDRGAEGLVLAIVAAVAGIGAMIRFAGQVSAGGTGAIAFFVGVGLVALAVPTYFVYRWLGKRGH